MTPSQHGKYPSDDETFVRFPSRRSVVHSIKGIVSTTSPLATEAGLKILREGGNAADAAVAAAAVLNLVDPSMTGIGGDAFCLFYDAQTSRVHALNGSGRSPSQATVDDICRDLGVTDRALGTIPTTSIHAVTVPGAAAAWVDIVETFGSGKTSRAQVLAPAIQLAEEGFPVSEISSYCWVAQEEELRSKPNGTDLLKEDATAPGGYRAPRAGESVRNPRLAKTLQRLADKGKRGFYEGVVAEAIVDISRQLGGYLTLDDLKRHESEVTEPTSITLELGDNGSHIHLWEHPPNGQGIVAQMALGILGELEKQGQIPCFTEKDHNTAPYLHAVIQALRIAFADGSWYVTDPSATIDPQRLLSRAYLSERAKLFDATKSTTVSTPGEAPLLGVHKTTSDTVYLCATDAQGNACSLVNSVADSFGSRVVPPGTGFVLQSRGAGFHLGPAHHPNVYAPGKRPYNTIMPALTTTTGDGALHSALGVMGGAMQPQGHVQVLLNMTRGAMNPQAALDAPRVCIGVSLPGKAATDPAANNKDENEDHTVYLEEGVSEHVGRALQAMGHEVRFVGGMARSLFGRGQVICMHRDAVDGTRIYSAGSDMRGDGHAGPLL